MGHNENGLGILSGQGKQVYKLTKERRHGKLVRDPATRECRRVSVLRHMAVGLGVGRGVQVRAAAGGHGASRQGFIVFRHVVW